VQGLPLSLQQYTALLRGFVEEGRVLKAKSLFHVMHADGYAPDYRTFGLMLCAIQARCARVVPLPHLSHHLCTQIAVAAAAARAATR
jgi:pentatricopeptide repeat protein